MRWAYPASPTRTTRHTACPATTDEPESTSSPTALCTGRDSPVSMDSSTSSPVTSSTWASAGTWSPMLTSSTSSSTTPSSATSCSVPSRTTRAEGAVRIESRSRVRLARYSVTIPIPALMTTTNPNTASGHRPVRSTRVTAIARIRLKSVNTLDRRIALSEREVACEVRLVCPASTRAATSWALSPRGPAVTVPDDAAPGGRSGPVAGAPSSAEVLTCRLCPSAAVLPCRSRTRAAVAGHSHL
ncbi:hypothetical protein D3C74_348360 [compost metagenome]